MSPYEVVASFWEEPCPEAPTGYVRHLRGSVIDIPDGHLDRLLRIGAVVPAEGNADAADPDDDDDSTGDAGNREPSDDEHGDEAGDEPDGSGDTPDANAVERPKQAAAKSVWVDYAVARGMDRDEADALEKRDLIAKLP
ncbi:hypothetical protein GS876_20965 [Rhodococcus hoagii]|nr:hypothetical protein [Prescottella equi]MBM4685606.1 hypothetical protein [Prescottella equi]NKU31560.1 hypothetical protein [Prescottella equi]NKU51522.1 hypothetical protein [Prescottella equi]NKV19380.1 hypothetical protein [Prescottella equi]